MWCMSASNVPQTSPECLALAAAVARGLKDCGVTVEAISLQAPNEAAVAVPVLSVRGEPARYFVADWPVHPNGSQP